MFEQELIVFEQMPELELINIITEVPDWLFIQFTFLVDRKPLSINLFIHV